MFLCYFKLNMSSSSADDSTVPGQGSPNSTDAQMFAWAGDNGMDLKRAYDELLAKNKEYEAAEQKRKKRKQKVSEKGEDFKPLAEIKTEDRLTEQHEFGLGRLARLKVWPIMKYYTNPYRADLLNMTYKALGMESLPNKERYADHIVFVADKKLTTHTHNCVGYLKRRVCGDDDSGGKLV